jgi:hypothetical protein
VLDRYQVATHLLRGMTEPGASGSVTAAPQAAARVLPGPAPRAAAAVPDPGRSASDAHVCHARIGTWDANLREGDSPRRGRVRFVELPCRSEE